MPVATSFANVYSGTDSSSKFSFLTSLGTSVTFTQSDSDTGASAATSGFDSSGGDVYGTLTYGSTSVAGKISGTFNTIGAYVFQRNSDAARFLVLKNGETALTQNSSTEYQYNSSFNSTDLTALNTYAATNSVDVTNPTVSISDNVAGTATGDVTFTFTFSEGVTGFDTSKLTVTNGTKGTFTAVNSTTYTLVVTPTTDSSGNITVATTTTGVTDAAGNVATAPANYTQAYYTVIPSPPADPGPPPPAKLNADLNQNSDTGASNNDRITSDVKPNFDINAGNLLSVGQTARLLDPAGVLVSSAPVTAADVTSGKVTIPTRNILDDGTYTYKAQILDATGRVIGESPVTIQIVTDKDGIMPSVELAANGGDFNKDGVKDWEQSNVTQLPLLSMTDFLKGKDAPLTSFGAMMAGKPDLAAPAGVKLNDTAQLVDVKLVTPPTVPLPTKISATSPMFAFTVQAQEGKTLTDSDTTREGLQVQTVISLPKGIKADAFMKFNSATNSWYNYANPGAITGAADGAALRDTNGDGLVDQIIITITDGGVGDEDGLVNGTVVDPGMLADTGATVLTSAKDKDGVAADVELAASNPDFNQDGVPDWDQGGITQLPLRSLYDYLLGKDAPLASFGMLMVGEIDASAPIGARMDTAGQLQGVNLAAAGDTVPTGYKAAAPVIELQAAPATGAMSLTDVDPVREGLQTQVIQYFATGIQANAYLLFDPISNTWFDYTDASALDGSADGAALLDRNKDGLIDAVVITLTDNGIGDDDITVNGVISLHGVLAWQY